MSRFINEAVLPVTIGIVIILIAGYYAYGKLYANKNALFRADAPEITIGKTAIKVAIADTDELRKQGLSWQKSLPKQSGMFFIFDTSDYHQFWMKDMVIPIDILWIDKTFHVVYIETNVQPNTYPKTFEPPVPARFVLEVPALFTQAYKINVGDAVVVPQELMPKDLKNK